MERNEYPLVHISEIIENHAIIEDLPAQYENNYAVFVRIHPIKGQC
jgi:hypothetical protein